MYTTQREIRQAFWREAPDLFPLNRISPSKVGYSTDRDYNADTRCAFVDFVDRLQRNGEISEALASRVTLE